MLLSVSATTKLGREPLTEGGTEVLPSTSFTLRFSRFLLPGTAIRQSLCVRTDTTAVTTFADCAGAVFLEPTYDPIRREITYRQSPTEAPLLPDIKYKLTVLAPVDEGSPSGIRAFDGAPLESARSYEFSTGPSDAAVPIEALPTGDTFCRTKKTCVAECAAGCEMGKCEDCTAACNCMPNDAACEMACTTCNDCQTACRMPCSTTCPNSVRDALTNCAFGSCHREDRDEAGALRLGAAMGLDMYTPGSIAATAVNRVAHGTQQGEHANAIDRSPLRFGRAMPIIDAATPGLMGTPGNSYLLYKLAVGSSATGEAAASADEIARLRASVLVGMPMPPYQGSPLSEADLNNLVTWIAQGAPTRVCPQ